MERITFIPGSSVRLFDQSHIVSAIRDNNWVELITDDGKITKTLELSTLFGHYQSGGLKPGPKRRSSKVPTSQTAIRHITHAAADHSNATKLQAQLMREVLRAINNEQCPIKDDSESFRRTVAAVANKLNVKPPKARTVQRWVRRLIYSVGARPLIPRFANRGGKGKSRCSPEVQDMMDEVIFNGYMTTERLSVARCYMDLCAKIAVANQARPSTDLLKTPSSNAFKRRIERQPAFDLYAARNGLDAAKKKFRSTGHNVENWKFMECVEVDHTVLDVVGIYLERGLDLGPPRITDFIEWVTRACVGFTIGFEGTSTQTVLECLHHSVTQKVDIRQLYPMVQGYWNCWGFPRYLKLDNGPEFHSETFVMSTSEMGVGLIYCPRKKAWFKGRVERMIKRLNAEIMDSLPGATLTQLYNRVTERDPSSWAVVDLESLRQIMHIWVIDVYHQTKHKGTNRQPGPHWDACFDLAQVTLPADLGLLEILCTELTTRTIFHYGIEICGERTFNNSELQALRRRQQFGEYVKVKVRYRPSKLDRIWVFDADSEEWLEVLNSNPATKDLGEFQLKMLHKMQREAISAGEQISILTARQRMRKLVESLNTAKSQRARKKALKLLGFTNNLDALSATGAADPEPQSDLENDEVAQNGEPSAPPNGATKRKRGRAAKTSDLPPVDMYSGEMPTYPAFDPQSQATTGAAA